MRIGDHLRATRVFVRRARLGRYFNRVPSRLPATNDGRGRSIAADLDSDGGDDVTWADGPEDSITGAGGASGNGQDSGAAIAGSATVETGRAAGDSSAAGDGSAGRETGTEFPAGDVAFLAAPDLSDGPGPASPAGREPRADSAEADSPDGNSADRNSQAGKSAAKAAAADAAPPAGESGRWFRP